MCRWDTLWGISGNEDTWDWDICGCGIFWTVEHFEKGRAWLPGVGSHCCLNWLSSDFGNIFDQNAFLKAESLDFQTGLQVAAVSPFPALTLCRRVFRVLNCILCTRVISYSLVGCIFNGLSLLAGDHLLGATFSTLGTLSIIVWNKKTLKMFRGQERRQH